MCCRPKKIRGLSAAAAALKTSLVLFTDLGIIAIRETSNEGMGIGCFGSFLNLLHSCTVFAIEDVFEDTGGKQCWLLVYQSDLLSQPLQLKVFDVEPIK